MTYTPPGPVFQPGVKLSIQDIAPDAQSGLVKSWSYSTLKKFEQCPYAVFLSKVKKIPTEQGEAAARGERIHLLGEQFIKGELEEFPEEFKRYRAGLENLRDQFNIGMARAEDEWAFTSTLTPTLWTAPDAWCRMKLDALEFNDDTCVTVTDFKTGRKFGNEMAHGQQLQLYAIATCWTYPQVEYIKTQCWYLDRDEGPLKQEYTRTEALSFQPRWTQRALNLTTTVKFPPQPSKNNCRWCDFAKNETCEWRYRQ